MANEPPSPRSPQTPPQVAPVDAFDETLNIAEVNKEDEASRGEPALSLENDALIALRNQGDRAAADAAADDDSDAARLSATRELDEKTARKFAVMEAKIDKLTEILQKLQKLPDTE